MHSKNDMEILNGWASLSKSCFWFYTFKNVCFVCEKPILISKDLEGRLHNETGPSVSFEDSWETYHWHGVTVPQFVIETPNKIKISHIEEEQNIEIRRVMIERYGIDKYIQDSGAIQIHKDKFGELYKKELKNDEPIVTVKVINSTPEIDGSRNIYFLRVPPTIETAHDAVAWTFGLDKKSYSPSMES